MLTVCALVCLGVDMSRLFFLLSFGVTALGLGFQLDNLNKINANGSYQSAEIDNVTPTKQVTINPRVY